MEESVYCIFSVYTMSSQRKFTFAISSSDEFLVLYCTNERLSESRGPFCLLHILV